MATTSNTSPPSDQALRRALGYRRFRGTTRVLVLDTSYYTLKDIVDGAHLLGWTVSVLPARGHGRGTSTFVEELLTALCTQQPDFVFTVNHRGFDEAGVLAGLLDQYQVPLCSWFVDPPLPVLGPGHADASDGAGNPNVTASCQVFCLERTALPWLKHIGFRDPVYLPTASNPRYFHPDRVPQSRAAALGAPLCFVGQSWWGIARQDPPPWARDAAAALLRHHPLTRDYVAKDLYHDLGHLPLPEIPDADVSVRPDRARARAAYVALAETSLIERQRLTQALRPLGLRIYGDAGWAHLAAGMDLHGQVDPTADLPAIYAGSAVNVNATAAGMPTALNLRAWDVPAAGGFLLTDDQEDLRAHFQPDEIAVYENPEDAAEKARYYLGHPQARQVIARRARARVESSHQYGHRLLMIDRIMRARFA